MSVTLLRVSQRCAVRRAVSVECQVVSERAFQLVARRTLDVSTGGLLVDSEADLEVGEGLIVSMRAPFTRLWIDAEAMVARLVRGRRAEDRGPRVGLRFVTMEPHERALLAASLHGVPPPVPARRLRRDYAAMVRAIAVS